MKKEEKKLCTLSREKGKPCERNNKNSKHIYVVCPMPFIEKKVSNKKILSKLQRKIDLLFLYYIYYQNEANGERNAWSSKKI